MRLKFWRWAHKQAEALWHWIYYNRIPEGIDQRVKAEITRTNGGWYSYAVKYMTSDGREVDPSVARIRFNGGNEEKNG